MKNLFGVPYSGLSEEAKGADVHCTSEEEAMALAAGTWLAGKDATVYMQDSGLCRCINIVLSLYRPYDIPLPELILSRRSTPLHHHFTGAATESLLRVMNYPKEKVHSEQD